MSQENPLFSNTEIYPGCPMRLDTTEDNPAIFHVRHDLGVHMVAYSDFLQFDENFLMWNAARYRMAIAIGHELEKIHNDFRSLIEWIIIHKRDKPQIVKAWHANEPCTAFSRKLLDEVA